MLFDSRHYLRPASRAAMATALPVLIAACATQSYEPQPLDAAVAAEQFQSRRLDNPDLRDFMTVQGYPVENWPLAAWDFPALWLAALFYHPELEIARAQWRLRQAAEKTAARRPPLGANVESEHHSDTPGGASPWSLGFVLDLLLERPGKRQARIDAARAQTQAARLGIGMIAWKVRESLRQRFLDLQDLRQRVRTAAVEELVVSEALALLERRQELGAAGSLEVSTMRLRFQRIQLDLAMARSGVVEARIGLAAAMGLPPGALESIRTALADMEPSLLPETDPSRVREQALLGRYDIRSALAEYAAAEAQLRLAIAEQYPDLTLSPGFLFDQDDNVWILDASWLLLLPSYTEGPIAEARARRDLAAARFKSLQADVIAQLNESLARYRGALTVLQTADALLEAQSKREAQVQMRLEIGYTDRLELLRAKIETLAARRAQHEAWINAHRALSRLENTIQQPLNGESAFVDRFAPLPPPDNDSKE